VGYATIIAAVDVRGQVALLVRDPVRRSFVFHDASEHVTSIRVCDTRLHSFLFLFLDHFATSHVCLHIQQLDMAF